MTRRWFLNVVVAFAVPIGVTACAQSGVTEADKEFVADLIPHHEVGVRMLEIGQERSSDVRLRRLIFEMGDYHHGELHTLDLYAKDWGIVASEHFAGEISDDALQQVQLLTGTRHDLAWLDAMIHHHEGAVEIAKQLLQSGGNKNLLTLAHGVIAIQTDEIVAMIRLQKDLCAQSTLC